MPMDIRNFFGVATSKKKKASSDGKQQQKQPVKTKTKKKNSENVPSNTKTTSDTTTTSPQRRSSPRRQATTTSTNSSKKRRSSLNDDDKQEISTSKKTKTTSVETTATDFFAQSPKASKEVTCLIDSDDDDDVVPPEPKKKAATNAKRKVDDDNTKRKAPSSRPVKRKSPPSSSSKKNTNNTAMLKPGLELPERPGTVASECWAGVTFVFSGVLENMSREEGMEYVKELGGRVTTAVSSKTNYLVLGTVLEDGRPFTEGSKYKKATAANTQFVHGTQQLYGLAKLYSDQKGGAAAAVKPETPAPISNPYAKRANPYAKKSTGTAASSTSNPYAKKTSNPYGKKKSSSNDDDRKRAAVPKASHALNSLWVDRYKPTSSNEILGNSEAVRKLQLWLRCWEDKFNSSSSNVKVGNPNGPFKAALLSGPPGIGKTTTATLVAAESGRDVLEFNASDVRSKKAMQESLGDITGSKTLSFGAKKLNTNKKRCLIMDEVDGMGAGDRSGMAELIAMIKQSKVPIICICNDRTTQKMKSLVQYCMDLRYKRPVKSVVATRAVEIAQQEGLVVERNAAEAVVESCGNDVRQVLNCLQMWASSNKTSNMTYKDLKDRERSIKKDEILRVSLFDAAKSILEGRRGLQGNTNPASDRDHFFKRNDAYFVDYSFTGLLVQQNYLKVIQPQAMEANRSGDSDRSLDVLNRMHDAAASMSDFAIVEEGLRSGQNWSLLPTTAALAVKAGYHAGGENGGMLPGFPEFTAWMGKNSSRGKKMRLLGELGHHMNYHISGGPTELRLAYLPVLRNRFMTLLSSNDDNGVTQAIELMDMYGMDRDDVFEKLDEFKMDSKALGFAKIESKKKAAFTRTYNAGTHKSQALVAEQGGGKKPKRAAAAAVKDPDAIDDDNQVEEEDDDDEELDDAKIKAMFGKKKRGGGGKKKAAPKKKAPATKKRAVSRSKKR